MREIPCFLANILDYSQSRITWFQNYFDRIEDIKTSFRNTYQNIEGVEFQEEGDDRLNAMVGDKRIATIRWQSHKFEINDGPIHF